MADMNDTTMMLDGALVQHGTSNDRIYLMDLGSADPSVLVPDLLELARTNNYGKIFAKIPAKNSKAFLDAGFLIEAKADKLFHGKVDGLFLGLFLDKNRYEESLEKEYENICTVALAKESNDEPTHESVRLCTTEDAQTMAMIYGRVFDSYPFPIDNPKFIVKSMEEGTVFAGIETDGELVALASAECSFQHDKRYAEMTDFATLPDARGNGYALQLLSFLEQEIKEKGILTAYTIARAISPGMNVTFGKADYQFGGRLHNNTDIAGNIESMNVWFKSL